MNHSATPPPVCPATVAAQLRSGLWGRLTAWTPSHAQIRSISAFAAGIIDCAAPHAGSLPVPPLEAYTYELVRRSEVAIGPLLAACVYFGRLLTRLPRGATGMSCTGGPW